MATKVDESNNGKKIRPKSSTASSPQGEASVTTTTKSKPNYLKPTISSSGVEARSNPKKQPGKAQVVSTRPARAAMERHPSSFKHPQKAPSPISTKEKPLLRSRSANQRTTAPMSPKAASDAATKSARGGKPRTPTKQWVLKKEATCHVKAPATTASDSTTTDTDNLSPTSDQQGRPDHSMDVQGSEKGDQDHLQEHEPTHEPTEEAKEEPEIKDVGEVIQITTNHGDAEKEQVDETHETGDAMQEPKQSPTSEVTDEEIAQESKQEEPIDDERILGTVGSSRAVAPATDKSNVAEGEENREDAKDQVRVSELKPELEKEVVKHKPKPEDEVARKTAVRGKKDAPVYNEVIEETVSKLAEKRKNRVLALAGAFETVISLHEAEAQAPKDRD